MSKAHLADETIRAYLDRELSPHATVQCAWHLRRCPECRARLGEERRVEERAAGLVSRLGSDVDVEEGWRRFAVLSRAARRRSLRRWPALGIAAVAVLTAVVLLAPGRWPWGGIAGLSGLQVQDVCCWDLDGGGPGDDGVFTLSQGGKMVACVIVYDDLDGSGDLSAPDVIRYVSNYPACARWADVRLTRPIATIAPASRLHASAAESGALLAQAVNSQP